MLKVKDTEKHHTSICDIAFRDPKTSSRLGGAPKTKNIVTFVKVCTHYEWFYNEDGKIGIICCKACFNVHLLVKPNLVNMTPLQIQKFSSGSNSFSSGKLC